MLEAQAVRDGRPNLEDSEFRRPGRGTADIIRDPESEDQFIEALTTAVINAPQGLGPLEALTHAFPSVEPLFIENRPFTAPRQRIIAGHAALQERAQTKTRAVISALAVPFRQRGATDSAASLAAQVGMATLGHAVAAWSESGSDDLGACVEHAFAELHNLSTSA